MSPKSQTIKYDSLSTPGVKHDIYNLLVETIYINKYGFLSPGLWRRGQILEKEWGESLKCIKRITKTLQISPRQLAWYISWYKIKNISYEDFGLLKWKIKKYFKYCNIDKLISHYSVLHESLKPNNSSYITDTQGYKTKEENKNHKSLLDILKELENG